MSQSLKTTTTYIYILRWPILRKIPHNHSFIFRIYKSFRCIGAMSVLVCWDVSKFDNGCILLCVKLSFKDIYFAFNLYIYFDNFN